jgi:ribosomal protein S18 acetylase RimI-like enzyme
MQIVCITSSNRGLVQDFLDVAGASLATFRYFNTRSLQSLDNHLLTCVLLDDYEKAIGYGHLDKEDGVVWLGIAIAESNRGKGYGKTLLEFLLSETLRKNIGAVSLSVDSGNGAARLLYESMGFIVDKETGSTCFYEKVM